MASLYVRKNRLWLAYWEGGKRVFKSTGLLANEKEKGAKLKAQVEREIEARKTLGLEVPRTVGAYKKEWLRKREAAGLDSAKSETHRLRHARELDALSLEDVKPRHIRDLVERLRREGDLAPRSVRHVYFTLRQMFRDAYLDNEGVMAASPCVLRPGDLPKKRDKSPTWRRGAIFTREEARALMSDARVPETRRVLYSVLFLAGLRIGEVSALRWRDYDTGTKPLGRLSVAHSYNRRQAKVKGNKTEDPREVPVHPALVKVLAAWRLGGWERGLEKAQQRAPTADDLLLPNEGGRHLRDNVVYKNLQRDLSTLGLGRRRTHDTRRTFISLALADGARRDLLKLVTHGAGHEILDLYTTIPWASLCEEVSKLNLRPVGTVTPKLHQIARD